MSANLPANNDLDRLDLDEIVRFLERRWRLIASTACGCAILALVVCLSLKPVYTATSQILLDPHRQHIFGQESVQPDAALDSSIVDSQISIITSTRLLAKVISKENLADDPEFMASAKPGLLDRLLSFLRPEKAKVAELQSLDGIDPKLGPVILHLFNKVEVTRIAKSYVLSVSVSSRDAEKAKRLADSLSDAYVEDQINVRAKSVQQAAAFFEDRLGSLRDQVRVSEQAVADYRKQHDLTTTTMDGKITVGEQQLQNLNEQLALAATDTAEKLARYQQAARFKVAGSSVDTLPEIIRSPVITQLRGQQADLLRRQSDLNSTYGPAYPAIAQIHAQRIGMEHAIAAEIQRLVSTLRNDYEVAGAREAGLRKTIVGLTNMSGGDNDVGVKLRELDRTNMANKALFENFLTRAKLTQEQSSFEEPDARLISPALEPSAPSSPKTKLIVPVAAVAGLILGLGLAAAADAVRGRRLEGDTDPREATSRGKALILGQVPEAHARLATAEELDDFFVRQPHSAYVKSIEALASKLLPGDAAGERVIALMSLEASEEAIGFAVAVATMLGSKGSRVLLIDIDDEQRGLSGAFGERNALGLRDVIAGDVSATRAISNQPRFAFLAAGKTRMRVTEPRLGSFLKEARGRYDLIFLATSALAAEAASLARGDLVDGLVLVACRDGLMHNDFARAVDVAARNANFLGVVLTRVEMAREDDLALAS